MSDPCNASPPVSPDSQTNTPSLFQELSLKLQSRLPQTLLPEAALLQLSYCLEDMVLRHQLHAVVFAGFQTLTYWQQATHRYQNLAEYAQLITMFAGETGQPGPALVDHLPARTLHLPLHTGDVLREEWFLLIASPSFCVLLSAQDHLAPAQAAETDSTTAASPSPEVELLFSLEPEITGIALDTLLTLLRQQTAVPPGALAVVESARALLPTVNDLPLMSDFMLHLIRCGFGQVLRSTPAASATTHAHYHLLDDFATGVTVIINMEVPEVVYLNAGNSKLLGYTTDQAYDLSGMLQRIPAADQDLIQQQWQQMIDHPEQRLPPLEFRILNAQGKMAWLEARSRVLSTTLTGASQHVLFCLMNITGRKEQEAALLDSRQQFERMVTAIPYGLHITDVFYDEESSLKLVVEYLSPAFIRLTGYALAELNSFEMLQVVVVQEDHPQIMAHVRRLLNGQESVAEYRIRRLDGSIIWIMDHARPFATEIPGRTRVYGVVTDVTTSRQMREALLTHDRLQAELEAARRLNMMRNSLMTTLSHEFRTPLTVILTSTETLERYRERMSGEDQDRRLVHIREQVWHLRNMLNDITTILHTDTGELSFDLQPIDLSTLINDLITSIRQKQVIPHPLTLSEQGIRIQVHGDARMLRQAFNKLLTNAVKYSPAASPITCLMTYTPNHVRLQIRDQGIGIPAEDLPYIFEAFHRGGNAHNIPGTGLGLKIVRDYVELHAGTITVESEVGQGTTFTITLPV